MTDSVRGRNRRIVLYGNPVLRRPAAQITEFSPEIRQLLVDLLVTMLEQDGLGLAANQIGEPVAAIAINPKAAGLDQEPCCIVNPRISVSKGKLEAEEGCLSFPGLYEVISRPEFVLLEGLDVEGRPTAIEGNGLIARVLTHEVDHLQGILFIDHLSPRRRELLVDRLREFEERERLACG